MALAWVDSSPPKSQCAATAVRALAVVCVVLTLLAGCAAGPNPVEDTGVDPAGFWLGLWQGVIAPVTLVVSLFNDNVGVYEVQNSGGWYDFGFLLGLSTVFSGGGGGAASGRRRG